jgi:hypothetical protein
MISGTAPAQPTASKAQVSCWRLRSGAVAILALGCRSRDERVGRRVCRPGKRGHSAAIETASRVTLSGRVRCTTWRQG